jgi:hypothetical protein
MGMLHHAMSGFVSFLSTSALSPLIVFGLLCAFVGVFRVRAHIIPWKTLSALICIALLASACFYLAIPLLQDDVESGVASVSALTLRGWPMYPDPQSLYRYIVAYGPLTFAARLPAYWLFGKTLFAFKFTGVLAFFATIAALYRICRHYATPGASLVGVGCCCVVFLRFIPIPFWGRGDPFILCMMALSVWAILEFPQWSVLAVAAVTFALLPNIKITAGSYLFPMVWLLVIRRGWKMAIGSVALGLVLFSLPFFSPQVSLANYWFALNNSRHALRIDILIRNFQYGALLLLPIISILYYRGKNQMALLRNQSIYAFLILCSVLIACFVGANAGSGPYHFVPCIVPILDLFFWLREDLPPAIKGLPFANVAVAWVLSTLVFSSVNLNVFLSTLRHAGVGRESISEIQHIQAAQPGRHFEVGVGKDFFDYRTTLEAFTTLSGQPATVPGLAIRELQVAGIDIPDSTIQYMEQCGTAVWLIPKSEAPFSAPDPYFGTDHPAFSQRFRDVFLTRYFKSESGPSYDVWLCKPRPERTN